MAFFDLLIKNTKTGEFMFFLHRNRSKSMKFCMEVGKKQKDEELQGRKKYKIYLLIN